MAEASIAQRLVELARRDEQVFRKLAADPDVYESIVGVHAKQAVGKALKAVLAQAGVAVRRTHDIAELLDIIADAGLDAPPHADRLDELNPYSVEYRYGLIDPTDLDRVATAALLKDVLSWSRAVVARSKAVNQRSEPNHENGSQS